MIYCRNHIDGVGAVVTSHDADDLEADLETIGNSLETYGFCIVETGDTQISSLLALASQFGRLQLHARADDRGMVEVSPNANLGKAAGKIESGQYTGTSDRQFNTHTDGAYLNGFLRNDGRLERIRPPQLLIMQCVRPASVGGASVLVDAERVLADLVHNEPERARILLSPGCVTFCRDDQMALDFPVFERIGPGHYAVRFRYDDMLYTQDWSDDGVHHLQKNYLSNPEYMRKVRLEAGQILVLDNTRMLHGRDALGPSAGGSGRLLRRVWIAAQDSATFANVTRTTVHHRAFAPHVPYRTVPGPATGALAAKLRLGIRPMWQTLEALTAL
jgi:hypothetical protein